MQNNSDGAPPQAQYLDCGKADVRTPCGRIALTVAKVALYREACDAGVTKAELARRLGWHAPKVDRLFDLRHGSKFEQIEQALNALGKRLVVGVQKAA